MRVKRRFWLVKLTIFTFKPRITEPCLKKMIFIINKFKTGCIGRYCMRYACRKPKKERAMIITALSFQYVCLFISLALVFL